MYTPEELKCKHLNNSHLEPKDKYTKAEKKLGPNTPT